MSLSELNWGAFVLLTIAVIGSRLLFAPFLPLDLLAISTPITIGFIAFLGLGVLAYSDVLRVNTTQFSFYIWISYVSFLVGATLLSSRKRVTDSVIKMRAPNRQLVRLALIYCILYVLIEIIVLQSKGGVPQILSVLFGGTAHREYVASLNITTRFSEGLGLSAILEMLSFYLFMALWVIVFIRNPRVALLLYTLHVIAFMAEYFSRSGLLAKLSVPYLAYMAFYRPNWRSLSVQLGVVVVATLVFFSWNAAIRLGQDYELSFEQVVTDTLSHAGGSVVPASQIAHYNLRGDPNEYIISMMTFLIPRALWESKPLIQYNAEITYLLTGRWVGDGTSIVTSTMLGEAWYFFGWIGMMILMMFFGMTAQFLERLLVHRPLTIGLFFLMWFSAFAQVRSTYLTFFQYAVILTGVSILLILIDRTTTMLSNRQLRHVTLLNKQEKVIGGQIG